MHTHSPWATAWAQAEREIPLLGTTHADLSARPIPLTRPLTESEIEEDYEGATGRALVEATTEHDSCALVRGHGPFAWGASPAAAVEVAVTLEQVARMALLTTLLAPDGPPLADAVRRKHFERKHGPHAVLRAVILVEEGALDRLAEYVPRPALVVMDVNTEAVAGARVARELDADVLRLPGGPARDRGRRGAGARAAARAGSSRSARGR